MDGGDLFWLILVGGPFALLTLCFVTLGFLSLGNKKARAKGVQIENIRAELILPSTNYRELEEFLLNKEPYLKPELITQLIDRIKELKTDAMIIEEFDAKLRVSLPPQEEEQLSFGDALIENERKRAHNASKI